MEQAKLKCKAKEVFLSVFSKTLDESFKFNDYTLSTTISKFIDTITPIEGIAAMLEGIRPMLIETQALVSKSVYSSPQRSATGFDLRRLGMLLAVLEKRGGFQYSAFDVFLNIAGGIKVSDPAIDLAIVAALISSLEDVAIPMNVCFAGEVGLSGEIRTVQRAEQRIQEANRLGFKKIIISKYNLKGLDTKRFDIEIVPIAKIEDLYKKMFK